MDLIDELGLMQSKSMDDAINHVKEKRKVWDQKLHILNVINVANKLEECIKDGLFDILRVSQIRIYGAIHYMGNEINYDIQTNININSLSVSEQKDYYNKSNELTYIFQQFNGFDSDNINNGFDVYLDLKGDIRQKIFHWMLSDELKKILDYSQMHMEVSKEKENIVKTKKPKV